MSSFYNAPWLNNQEPNSGNVRHFLDSLYSKFQPLEQARWNQSNIDTLFYAGNQSFVNQQFSFNNNMSYKDYYFNLVQQPVNMITGYERQHRKNFSYIATEGADPLTTDEYTTVITHVANQGCIHEQKSKAKELAAISGLVLVQPYLDFTNEDQAQGTAKCKIWEYNSFLADPYFRNPDMSDAQFVWCQEYISTHEADNRFPEKIKKIRPMNGSPQQFGRFYFLPENHNMNQNDLMIISYIWYKWKTKRKRLYSRSRHQFFDFAKNNENLEEILYGIPDLEEVTVEVPTWKLATILNDELMYSGENPLGFDDCPFIPYFWNYDPHINHNDLRVRSLIRPMRSPQFLFNYKIIQNNDIASATINAGWKRKIGAVANEDNLKKSGQGYDIIINENYELTDCEKIIPSAVPQSDLELAQQMSDLVFQTSGINLENWSGQNDKQISSLTLLMKQAANLMVFQKYFDQWDFSDKLLGDRILQMVLNNWNEQKIALYLGREPSPHFYSKIFAKYQTIVEESDLTPTQQNLQAQQMMDMNQLFQREVFPPSMIIPKLNITGKSEIINFLQQQEEQMQAAQSEEMNLKHTVEEVKLKEMMAKIHNQLSHARERDSRSASNVGLFEERMSMISRNHSLATKDKMAALAQLMETIQKFGEVETFLKSNSLDYVKSDDQSKEDESRKKVEESETQKQFIEQLMGSTSQQQPMQNNELML